MRQTVLIVSPIFPFPASSGARADIVSRIDFLAKRGLGVIVAVCNDDSPTDQQKELGTQSAHSPQITFLALRRNARWAFAETDELLGQLRTIVAKYKPSLIVCEYAELSGLAESLRIAGVPIWCRCYNFEVFHFLERTFARLSRPSWGLKQYVREIAKLLSGYQLLVLAQIYYNERRMLKVADRLLYISWSEAHEMPEFYRWLGVGMWLPPLLRASTSRTHTEKQSLDVILISGNFRDPIQRSALDYLLEEILPRAKRQRLDRLVFHVVGSGGEFLAEHTDRSVQIHGYIEDLPAFLNTMDVACIPARIGRGLKIKMLEAMISGLPVVAAHQVFRSVPIVENAWYACHSPDDYVVALEKLSDRSARQQIADSARNAAMRWIETAEVELELALAEIQKGADLTRSAG